MWTSMCQPKSPLASGPGSRIVPGVLVVTAGGVTVGAVTCGAVTFGGVRSPETLGSAVTVGGFTLGWVTSAPTPSA